MATEVSRDVERPNFKCQHCCQPLVLDPSFMSREEKLCTELTSPLGPRYKADNILTHFPSSLKSNFYSLEVWDFVPKQASTCDETYVLESCDEFFIFNKNLPDNVDHKESLGHRERVQCRLSDFLSDETQVQHSLCEECADAIHDLLDDQLSDTENKCKEYEQFMKVTLLTEKEDIYRLRIAELKEQEETLVAELSKVEEERAQVLEELKFQKCQRDSLNSEFEKYLTEKCKFQNEEMQVDLQQLSLDNQLQYALDKLEELKLKNSFNTAFHIERYGPFGKINEFRLGRLKNDRVEWSEINAAWGQAVLLLYSLAKKMNVTFQKYRLVPYGSYSYIEESINGNVRKLPLYGSIGFSTSVWDTGFDQAMVAFLDCIVEFKNAVEKEGATTLRLPYKIYQGKLADANLKNYYSIKIQFNEEVNWTKALNFMLTNLNWVLAWVSSELTKGKPNSSQHA